MRHKRPKRQKVITTGKKLKKARKRPERLSVFTVALLFLFALLVMAARFYQAFRPLLPRR